MVLFFCTRARICFNCAICHFADSVLAFQGTDPHFRCLRCFLAPLIPNNLCSSRMVREARCTISPTAFGGGVAISPKIIGLRNTWNQNMHCLHLVVVSSAVSANVLCKTQFRVWRVCMTSVVNCSLNCGLSNSIQYFLKETVFQWCVVLYKRS